MRVSRARISAEQLVDTLELGPIVLELVLCTIVLDRRVIVPEGSAVRLRSCQVLVEGPGEVVAPRRLVRAGFRVVLAPELLESWSTGCSWLASRLEAVA